MIGTRAGKGSFIRPVGTLNCKAKCRAAAQKLLWRRHYGSYPCVPVRPGILHCCNHQERDVISYRPGIRVLEALREGCWSRPHEAKNNAGQGLTSHLKWSAGAALFRRRDAE